MRHDAIVIGGSFAGLSAAMYIARARRSVVVVDAGAPRNRFAGHAHGFFAHDGVEPGAILTKARAQVAAYPTVRFVSGTAVRATRSAEGFEIELASRERIEGAKIVLAFGVSDELPQIPGIAEHWGRSVLHCPYCHGYEFAGEKLGVLYAAPPSAHQAMLIAEWGPTTLFLNGATLDEETRRQLAERGVAIEPGPVTAVLGDGARLSGVQLEDGRTREVAALYLPTRTRLNSDLAEQLGCAVVETPTGRIVSTDEMKQTNVPGVFAAGDITRSMHNITWATADGVMAATALHRSLVF